MMNPQETSKFWRLLADYEALTCREAVAILHQDYIALNEAQLLKSAIFPVWQRLGADLRLNRLNCPELHERLEAISHKEASNLETLATQYEAAQNRVSQLAVSRQRLRTVGKNYHEGPSGDVPASAFAALG